MLWQPVIRWWSTTRGRGKQSGIEAAWPIWQVWTLRDGKGIRGQGFTTESEALKWPVASSEKILSQENLELVRVMVEAFRRRDTSEAAGALHADVEWDTTRMATVVPDLTGTFRGPEGTRELWRAWLSTWMDIQFDYELRDAGDDAWY